MYIVFTTKAIVITIIIIIIEILLLLLLSFSYSCVPILFNITSFGTLHTKT